MELQGKRIAYITLGCKLNFSETSTIRRSLEQAGALSVSEEEAADICIINTCSVTDMAEKKGRQVIRKIARRHPGAYIVVVGCYAQLRGEEIQAIEGVNLVLSAEEKFAVGDRLRAIAPRVEQEYHAGSISHLDRFDPACSHGDRTRGFLKIQDGCDYFCSYCTIPHARGRSRSASIRQVLEMTQEAAAKSIKEIILTGVNTGDFGRGRGETFLDLLRALEAEAGIERYRVSSIEPNLLTGEIIDFMASSHRFMPHFHLPLQSGNDEVLALMGRRYTRAFFAERVTLALERIPDAFIGVDVIAGMRGETEEMFEESLRFIAGLDIARLHVFPYSERAGTRALSIPYAVPAAEKRHRVEALLALSDEKIARFYRRFEGATRPVLFEESNVGGSICGFTDNYIRVALPYDPALVNRIVPVKLDAHNMEL
ncbi:MAG: tRNA (N(6)-L-threonylcarbamoyladenosine(37)-C(2))-methylthiotransferase MtaB [Odoribacteraceae bacterium]|jgi:threonylcarbamoyladenosine tRNA methylthiotransferase MtaB|nr:tRNA (N(6)-L-threonylcarbamoyladenosine(37)-C(2))-methylthiotransferase MtaB [Odoribacteraceae bacterium]